MKKVIVMFLLIAISTFSFLPTITARVDLVCKVEVIDCPGWGTGDRQVCHQNGTGLTCTCGQSTKCPAVASVTN